jgi:hypothetical protein
VVTPVPVSVSVPERNTIFSFTVLVLVLAISPTAANDKISTLPIRGFAIAAPSPDRVDDFVDFIDNELVPNNVNTLVLRVDYRYRYKSHPELRDEDALRKSDVRKIVKACRKGGIRLIPQINLLGHQSWQSELGRLLEVYPEFDETPWIDLPETYEWPNADGLYCKSYCPLWSTSWSRSSAPTPSTPAWTRSSTSAWTAARAAVGVTRPSSSPAR